jgi:hypothetical protein
MTKNDMMRVLAEMPGDTELEIHIETDDGSASADFTLEPIGEVIGAHSPQFFTFRVGDFISDCGGNV